MKGVVLCGGTGSRLSPLTRVTNKHLLPVYDRPMVFYPIQTLVDAGIREIMVVTGGNNAGDFVPLLRNGQDFGLSRLHYGYQEGAGGIAAALRLAREFVGEDPVTVILGDNIYGPRMGGIIRAWARKPDAGARACVFLKEVDDPQRFGVAEIGKGRKGKGERIVGIVEKPKTPKTNWAVTGAYIYPAEVFSVIETLKPSGRGELEITDVNNHFVGTGELGFRKLDAGTSWTDAGTFDSLLRANEHAAAARRGAGAR
jgi:glucose-1-phosphate thymidylyltransferase